MKCDKCGAESATIQQARLILGKVVDRSRGGDEFGRIEYRTTFGGFETVEVGLCQSCMGREGRKWMWLAILMAAMAVIAFALCLHGIFAEAKDPGETAAIGIVALVSGAAAGVFRWLARRPQFLLKWFAEKKGFARGFTHCWTPAEFEKSKRETAQEEWQREKRRLGL